MIPNDSGIRFWQTELVLFPHFSLKKKLNFSSVIWLKKNCEETYPEGIFQIFFYYNPIIGGVNLYYNYLWNISVLILKKFNKIKWKFGHLNIHLSKCMTKKTKFAFISGKFPLKFRKKFQMLINNLSFFCLLVNVHMHTMKWKIKKKNQ